MMYSLQMYHLLWNQKISLSRDIRERRRVSFFLSSAEWKLNRKHFNSTQYRYLIIKEKSQNSTFSSIFCNILWELLRTFENHRRKYYTLSLSHTCHYMRLTSLNSQFSSNFRKGRYEARLTSHENLGNISTCRYQVSICRKSCVNHVDNDDWNVYLPL